MSTIEKAVEIATKHHAGDVDKDFERLKEYVKVKKLLIDHG